MRLLAAALVAAGPAWAEGPLPSGAVADYQLGGSYPPAPGVTVVVRDSTDVPEPGLFNVCYVNGFQTQPGAEWPTDLLLRDEGGYPLADPGWPDEFLLDISSSEARAANLALVAPAIRACAEKGFDAVEFDNLDSYSRSGGRLDVEDALAFAALLVAEAGKLGLPAGQKNSAELGARGRDEAGFAFAVTEECHRWDECAAFTGVYGRDQVLGIEYADDLRGSFAEACADPDRPGSLILRDRMLTRAGSEGYVFDACPSSLVDQ
ncbi:endo alpha-1,4 polygalactosaminidase [Tabrizicola sp.]|uniref:endo alpha-1,4 polygalactosaminidase n=1 Tax=Tabrizicola sp. TaxID=2005166 RepID=UPI0035AFA3CA